MLPSYTKTYHSTPYPSISPSRPDLSAKDKVILVTGAGSGIGQATAIAFAQADAKALILCGRRTGALQDTKAKIEALQKTTHVLAIQLDVSDEDSVDEAFARVKEEVGKIDILINAAGHLGDMSFLKDMSLSNFWTSVEINLKGPFLVSRAFLRSTIPTATAPKTLILLSSIVGGLPSPQFIAGPQSYPISKIAEAKLAEALAAENTSHFRAYALQPGIVESAMSEKSVSMAPDPEATRAAYPWDEPELPARFMLWLCSKRGECVPSGRFLWINWDVDELEAKKEEMEKDSGLLTMGLMGWPFV
ncbi:NAD(P)-binding protein [Trematosphaeria pertusa]|uniref:NAD(P)-binding protein n=1 Tax=Trematosphaeria pertusa TaxID=390896 RepID=A0A6A6IIC6_9PLEO|nr:NAD(P)-binding protein [Trematosphaeria pertusa]KAF2250365.1 NAD(P)-binding protein [Trematosphaeria pertusa]